MIDPQARAVLRNMQVQAKPMQDDENDWLRGYRAQLDTLPRLQGPPPELEIVETTCPGPGALIRLRAYRPIQHKPLATVLFCHGGGFVAGTLHGYDVPLRWLALRSGWQVVAVDYRLAPEHPYPAAPEDCMAALRYLAAGGVNADPMRLVVAGDSAGGLLATVLARRARDEKLSLRLQVLLYPNTDLREDAHYASRVAFDGTVIRIDELYRSLRLYLGRCDRRHPDVSPMLAPDLDGLCPALLFTNECDPLRDEAERYADRLKDAGVPVAFQRLPGMVHGVLQMAAALDAGDALITCIAEALRRA